MRLTLEPHPHSSAPAIAIAAEARRRPGGRLDLHYRVTGEVANILLPPSAKPERVDGLWRHSCFEAFVRAAAEAGYVELNLSPSGQWAAYRFSDYRAGMAEAEEVPAPEIQLGMDAAGFELSATVDLGEALGLLADLPWQVGLAAVIEDREGGVSHWALTHSAGVPDFHHRDGFALELPPA